jgi:hypothetical protein
MPASLNAMRPAAAPGSTRDGLGEEVGDEDGFVRVVEVAVIGDRHQRWQRIEVNAHLVGEGVEAGAAEGVEEIPLRLHVP